MFKDSVAGGEGKEQVRNSILPENTAAMWGEFVLEPEGELFLLVFSPADEIVREDSVILCFPSVAFLPSVKSLLVSGKAFSWHRSVVEAEAWSCFPKIRLPLLFSKIKPHGCVDNPEHMNQHQQTHWWLSTSAET